MVTVVIVGFLLVCTSGIGELIIERTQLVRAQQAEQTEDLDSALARYTTLINSRPMFLDRGELGISREGVAAKSAKRAVEHHRFAEAVSRIALVLEEPDSGFEQETQVLAAELPLRQMDWVRSLQGRGDYVQALQQCAQMRELYSPQPQLLSQIRAIEGRVRLEYAQRLARDGDVSGVLQTIAELDSDTPGVLQDELEQLTFETVRNTYSRRLAYQDRDRLKEWIERVAETLEQPRPNLAQRIRRLANSSKQVASMDRRPLGEGGGAVLPIEIVGPSSWPDMAELTLQNESDSTVMVRFHGRVFHQVHIGSGGVQRFRLPTGTYMEHVMTGSGTRPYRSEVTLDRFAYRQRLLNS